jgi:hypothetical protein
MQVSAEGGPTVEATRLDAGQVGHAFPHFLPDGRHFLFCVSGAPASRGIHVGQLDGALSKRLVDADGGGVYTNGHLLFIRQANVFAQPFDTERLELEKGVVSNRRRSVRPAGTQYTPRYRERRGVRIPCRDAVRGNSWVDARASVATVGDRLGGRRRLVPAVNGFLPGGNGLDFIKD